MNKKEKLLLKTAHGKDKNISAESETLTNLEKNKLLACENDLKESMDRTFFEFLEQNRSNRNCT